MAYVFPPMPPVTLPVKGSNKLFPLRRIFCVGRNYAEHAREMGADPDRELPFFFTKPADAIVQNGATIPYPKATENLHYEMELVIGIGKQGEHISIEAAEDHIFGYAVGIDLTRRDLQNAAKKSGRPWDSGKAFDQSAPCSEIVPLDLVDDLKKARIWLTVNGDIKQDAHISDLIWSVPEVISILSDQFILQPGDLIYTGTPAGVGPVVTGDNLIGGVDGIGKIEIQIS
jgi:fumarylpyruvate hydrolase